MNLFAIEGDARRDVVDWRASARAHDDYRVGKMGLEAVQILCTAARVHGFEVPYRATHARHPSVLWASASRANFEAVMTYAEALFEERARRFGGGIGGHRSHAVLQTVREVYAHEGLREAFEHSAETPLPQCMPEEFRGAHTIRAYRRFWRAKPRMRYRRGDVPRWFRRGRALPFELID